MGAWKSLSIIVWNLFSDSESCTIFFFFFVVVFGNKKFWECFTKLSLSIVLKSFEFDSKQKSKLLLQWDESETATAQLQMGLFLKLHVVDNSFPERHVVLLCVTEPYVDIFFIFLFLFSFFFIFFWFNYKLCLLILSRIQLILVFFLSY